MFDDLKLMGLHIQALFTCDAKGRLLGINEPDPTTASPPRLFLGRTLEGNLWRFSADLPEELVSELNSLCSEEPPLGVDAKEPPIHAERYTRLLEPYAPIRQTEAGPAYRFPKRLTANEVAVAVTQDNVECLRGGFEKLVEELPAWQPFVAVLRDEAAVSVCRSVRIISEVHEAGVETLAEFRGQGFAAAATAQWAEEVRALGAFPIYSTSWTNHASQAAARKLGLELYGVDFHIS